jgi:hypothetical protein
MSSVNQSLFKAQEKMEEREKSTEEMSVMSNPAQKKLQINRDSTCAK